MYARKSDQLMDPESTLKEAGTETETSGIFLIKATNIEEYVFFVCIVLLWEISETAATVWSLHFVILLFFKSKGGATRTQKGVDMKLQDLSKKKQQTSRRVVLPPSRHPSISPSLSSSGWLP